MSANCFSPRSPIVALPLEPIGNIRLPDLWAMAPKWKCWRRHWLEIASNVAELTG